MVGKRRGPDRLLVVALRSGAGAALALALATVVLPGGAGRLAGSAMLVVLIAAPVLRVARLSWTWWRQGDVRFARLGVALLAVLALSPAVGWLTS